MNTSVKILSFAIIAFAATMVHVSFCYANDGNNGASESEGIIQDSSLWLSEDQICELVQRSNRGDANASFVLFEFYSAFTTSDYLMLHYGKEAVRQGRVDIRDDVERIERIVAREILIRAGEICEPTR